MVRGILRIATRWSTGSEGTPVATTNTKACGPAEKALKAAVREAAVGQPDRLIRLGKDSMMIAMIRCQSCASPLDQTVRWARLLVEEPEVFVCNTEWGSARFEFRVPEIPVRCSCGQERIGVRDHPLAVA